MMQDSSIVPFHRSEVSIVVANSGRYRGRRGVAVEVDGRWLVKFRQDEKTYFYGKQYADVIATDGSLKAMTRMLDELCDPEPPTETPI